MRITAILLMLCAAGWAAKVPSTSEESKGVKPPAAAGKAPKTEAKPAARPVPAPLVVPPGAKQTAPYTWLYVGPQGRRWIYRETPFGIVRYDEKIDLEREKADKPSSDASQYITAAEDGDSIRFERAGPFGTWKWTKKKTELDEVETRAWERSRPAASAPENAAPAKTPAQE